MNTDIVRLEQVNISFSGKKVVHNVSFNLHTDCITTLIGPNGAGKTTLVKTVLGLIKPDTGKVWLKDDLVIGYVPQKLHIDSTFPLTVQRFLQISRKLPSSAIADAVASVSISHLLQSSIHGLSGGEMQRLLLARALLRNPQLLVLDEPVQGVDINGQVELYQLISDIRKQRGCGVLMISHDLHLVMSATDHVICMNQHICCSGHPEKITSDPSYIDLFGAASAKTMALYAHHHNHDHNLHGDVLPGDPAVAAASHQHTPECKH
ncbi:MAG: zinc ABC transporter ATP-binding protein ZnuC [Pseudomonadales bacterium]|nr:zinc ABC transporter ATP-binding protein ZnuC [Pseudomonadales bacterium]NRA15736.1 zinc ABC transporter ATP-binding protein ZnuC [Oceanospirillaceae bacterium]